MARRRRRGTVSATCQVCGRAFDARLDRPAKCCGSACANEYTRRRNRASTGERNPNWRGGTSVGPRSHYVGRWIDRNPEKRAAQLAVKAALKAGRLERQPCERCGTTDDVHGHHDDYAKPLEVMWLCRDHHRERHAEIGRPMHRRVGQTDAALAQRVSA